MIEKPKKKETRDGKISARIKTSLLKKVIAHADKKKWTISDVIEEALTSMFA